MFNSKIGNQTLDIDHICFQEFPVYNIVTLGSLHEDGDVTLKEFRRDLYQLQNRILDY